VKPLPLLVSRSVPLPDFSRPPVPLSGPPTVSPAALFTAIVGTMGAKFVIELMHTDQVSPDLELPSWLVYACIPLGSYLMCFRFLQVMWAYFWTDELPHHDAAHVEGIETSKNAPIALGEA